MTTTAKDLLHDYLRGAREALVWKTEGLSEYDVRRPLTPTGTNLLGLVKHLAVGESRYLGDVFGRPFEPYLPWWDDDQPEDVDMWATPEEGRDEIIGIYRAASAHADETIRTLDLEATGYVPWWPSPHVTLHGVLVHVLSETSRHAGHADILREQLDGAAGMRAENSNLPERQQDSWNAYRAKVEAAAREAGK